MMIDPCSISVRVYNSLITSRTFVLAPHPDSHGILCACYCRNRKLDKNKNKEFICVWKQLENSSISGFFNAIIIIKIWIGVWMLFVADIFVEFVLFMRRYGEIIINYRKMVFMGDIFVVIGGYGKGMWMGIISYRKIFLHNLWWILTMDFFWWGFEWKRSVLVTWCPTVCF